MGTAAVGCPGAPSAPASSHTLNTLSSREAERSERRRDLLFSGNEHSLAILGCPSIRTKVLSRHSYAGRCGSTAGFVVPEKG